MFQARSIFPAVVLILSLCVLCSQIPTAAAPQADAGGTTIGPNLIYNGDFDNGIWYERYRGWSPAGWYQWFTCGDDAPEHAVGRDKPHTGKEYVRIHMWAHNWRGGVLQNVRDVQPGHWYRLTGYGWFAKTAKEPKADTRIGLDPFGKLYDQYSVDVTKHPAPPYNECVGDDPKTAEVDRPDIPDTTVWDGPYEYYNDWGKYTVEAEAQSDVVTAILYSVCPQREASEPIYEMNWDSISMVEIPWPTKRLSMDKKALRISDQINDMIVTMQPSLETAQVTWRTKDPAGAAQVLYRWVTASPAEKDQKIVILGRYPFESPVLYEDALKAHWVSVENLEIPDSAAALEVVALSRVLVNGRCETICSAPQVFEIKR